MRLRWALGLIVCVAESASACSLVGYTSVRTPGVVSFIGVASPDTSFAGAGSKNSAAVGATRSIFGQVVRIDRLGVDAQRILVGRARSSKEIVVVPWAYGADCRTLAWTASARWVAPDTRGVFTGRLRDTTDWIDGRPTIDVTAHFAMPYTGVIPFRYTRSSSAADSALTPDQALDLYDRLPPIRPPGAPAAAIRAAAEPLLQWANDHADLSRRYPAREVLRETRYAIEMAVIRGVKSPLAGTYRFTIRLATGDSATIVARTEEYPASALWSTTPGTFRSSGSDSLPASVGHELLIQVALSEIGLPLSRAITDTDMEAEGYLTLVDAPIATSRDSTVWRGSADLLGAASRVVRDSVVATRLRDAEKRVLELLLAKAISFAEGRFVTRADGSIHYFGSVSSNGALLYSIRGERLSTTTLSPR